MQCSSTLLFRARGNRKTSPWYSLSSFSSPLSSTYVSHSLHYIKLNVQAGGKVNFVRVVVNLTRSLSRATRFAAVSAKALASLAPFALPLLARLRRRPLQQLPALKES